MASPPLSVEFTRFSSGVEEALNMASNWSRIQSAMRESGAVEPPYVCASEAQAAAQATAQAAAPAAAPRTVASACPRHSSAMCPLRPPSRPEVYQVDKSYANTLGAVPWNEDANPVAPSIW